jgi:serine O-acetyltransferase
VVGIPGRITRIAGEKVHYADDVDQIHDIVDPIEFALEDIQQRQAELERQMNQTGESSH